MLVVTVASEISRPYLNKRVNHKNKIQFLRDSNIYQQDGDNAQTFGSRLNTQSSNQDSSMMLTRRAAMQNR